MNKTRIEWCDYTWNPITGCSPASEGCDNCYAAALSRRFNLPWGHAVFHEDRIEEPTRVEAPRRIFVSSMGDLFHESVQFSWLRAIWSVMRDCEQHTFIVLTKRADEAWHQIGKSEDISVLPNVWVGVTAETQAMAYYRLPKLMKIPAVVRFVSVEPMLEPVSILKGYYHPGAPSLDWVIAGPETGPRARPCRDAWIDALAAETPCFFDKRKTGWKRREWPRQTAARSDASLHADVGG
jgi:protein gp37